LPDILINTPLSELVLIC